MSVSDSPLVAEAAQSSAKTLRTGAEYIRSIGQDGRQVFLNGKLVRDVTVHPAFKGAVQTVARLYNIAAAPENRELMTFESPTSHSPVLRCYQIPGTIEALAERRRMSEKWAEATCGLMGRSPDHVAGFLSGFAAKPEVFGA